MNFKGNIAQEIGISEITHFLFHQQFESMYVRVLAKNPKTFFL